MSSESARLEPAADDDRSSPSSGSSDGGASRNNLRRPSSRVALLLLGTLIAGVAGLQLLSQPDADSNGESSAAGDTQTFAAHGVSLTFPAPLRHLEGEELETLELPIFKSTDFHSDPAWVEVFAFDEHNLVAVYPVPEPLVVTSGNVTEHARLLGAPSGYGAPVVSESVVQGLPLLRLVGGMVEKPSGTVVGNDVTMVFSGSMNYTVECQSTPPSSREIIAACTHIIESLRVPAPSVDGWHVLTSDDDEVRVSVPHLWRAEPSRSAAVNLAAKLRFQSSGDYVVSLWITVLHEPYVTESGELTGDIVLTGGMKLTHERSVRLPIGTAVRMVIEKDDSSNIIYIATKNDTAVIVSFDFALDDMRLVRPTIDAVVQTLKLD
jgi:hypothetical protein